MVDSTDLNLKYSITRVEFKKASGKPFNLNINGLKSGAM